MSKQDVSSGIDKSPRIIQREKIKEPLAIRDFVWTPKQIELINLIKNKESKIIFLSGPSGSSKSLISLYCGLYFLNNKRIDSIFYSRPILESSDPLSKLGYLPGNSELKIEPYLYVAIEKLEELLPQSQVNKLKNDNRINFLPVNYARGRQIAGKYWAIDEAQGFCTKELITLLTRVGEASKVIVAADPFQSDLPLNKQGGFIKLFNLFNNDESKENGIFTFEFTKQDVMRSKLCKFLVEKFERFYEI